MPAADARGLDEDEYESDGSIEHEDNGNDEAQLKGYCGDNPRKPIPAHNVAETGPVIVWGRGQEPKKALDFFLLFFPFQLMQTIVNNSNLYAVHGEGIGKSYMAQSHGELAWRKIDMMEFRRFLACLIYMGIVKTPTRENYWQNDVLFSGLLGSMFLPTFRRYCAILAALHCVDPANEDRLDPLSKIRNIYDFLRSRCKELFVPKRCVSIDERMVKSKGRFFFKQYIRNKPTKWGFKLWVLADSSTGYNWDMVVYTGRKRGDGWDDFTVNEDNFQGIPEGLGRQKPMSVAEEISGLLSQLAARVVIKLTEPLKNKGYILFVDNYYTSIPLFQYLSSVGIHAVGTIRENTSSFPETMKNRAAWGKNKDRGTVRYERVGASPHDVLLLQWVDRNVVSILSTYHSANDFGYCRRNLKDGGHHRRVEIMMPQCIKDYNNDMNGVDLSDQMYRLYSVQYRTKKFWKTLFFHFIDIALWNAFVFWSEMKNPTPEQKMPEKYTFLNFKMELVKQLAVTDQKAIKDFGDAHTIQPYASLDTKTKDIDSFASEATSHAVKRIAKQAAKNREGCTKDQEWDRRMTPGHLPVKLDKPRICKVCSVLSAVHASNNTKRPKRSMFACVECDIPLCIGERNCFLFFHSAEFSQYKEPYLEHCRHS